MERTGTPSFDEIDQSLPATVGDVSGIDLNRAGTPLLEIVSEPDLGSSAEAVAYAKKTPCPVYVDRHLRRQHAGREASAATRTCRCAWGRLGPLGTRCEIKNLNSFRFMQQAIDFEVRRQIELIEDGGTVVQETRLYDADRDETRPMRGKEDAQDYRYFPDPDLPPLVIDDAWIERVRARCPSCPRRCVRGSSRRTASASTTPRS